MLRKTRGLTLVAVVSLAAGIGANAAIFSIVNSIFFRPRPVADPGRLVELYVGDEGSRYESSSYPSYLDLREDTAVLSGLAAYGPAWQFTLGTGDGVERVWGEVVSANYFAVLGVPPALGRMFLPEDSDGQNTVAVISHGLWLRRFTADPGIIGRTIAINNHPFTIIGVTPPSYHGMLAGLASEIWVPSMAVTMVDPARGERLLSSRGSRWVIMVGRLAPGRTLEAARSRFALLTSRMQASHPDEWRSREEEGGVRELFITVLPERATRVHPSLRAPAYALALLLFAIVDLVLIIACMNLAGMFFARAVARRKEITVRLALGASRGRIVRQLLTESMILSLLAGAAGTVLALLGLNALLQAMPALPEGVRLGLDLALDWKVVAYSFGFALLTGLLFGLAPALHASRGTIASALQEEGGHTVRIRRSRLRTSLVIAQVAGALLLLIGAGLVQRSLANVQPTRLGFATRDYLVVPVGLDEVRYDRARGQQFFEQLGSTLASLPGVRAVGLVQGMPGGFLSRSRRSTTIDGYVPAPGEDLELDASVVGPGYFTGMKVPLVAGRDFDARDRDGAPCVTIINEALADRYLGGVTTALGRRMSGDPPAGQPEASCEIVGIIRDTEWQSLNREVRPFFALPLLQSEETRMTAILETAGAPAAVAPAVRNAIRQLDPLLPVTEIQTLQGYFETALYPFRLFGGLLGASGGLALLLALIGVYGTVSYFVAQRQRELGIRMAIGAGRGDVLRLVLGQGMAPVGYGLVLGILVSLALTRVLTSLPLGTDLLFGVAAVDGLTFGAVSLMLAGVALLACYFPARRATRIDPMAALRNG